MPFSPVCLANSCSLWKAQFLLEALPDPYPASSSGPHSTGWTVTECPGLSLPAEVSGVLLALDGPDAQSPVTETGLPTELPHWPATCTVTLNGSWGCPGCGPPQHCLQD